MGRGRSRAGGGGRAGGDRCVDRWMNEWMDRLTRVCKRLAMATLAEATIRQRPSECIGEGGMDGICAGGESLTQHGGATKHDQMCMLSKSSRVLASASSSELGAHREASLTPRGQLRLTRTNWEKSIQISHRVDFICHYLR